MHCIHQTWNQEVTITREFLIIYSLFQFATHLQLSVKIFRDIAGISYKTTKKICYYGSCYSKLALYTVTQVLVHNAKNNEINARLSLKQLGIL